MDLKIDKKTVVVFDLDDTLYNELDFLKSAFKEICSRLDSKNSKFLFSVIFSMYRNKKNVFEYLSDQYKIDKDVLLDMYRNHFPNLNLKESSKKLFDSIKKKKGKIGIITDGRSYTQRNKIRALEIEKYVDCTIISEEIGAEKPSEMPFLKIQDYFKLENYIYVADNTRKDFLAPNKLGWDSIELVDNGKNIHSNSFLYLEPKFRAKNIIYSLAEIEII